MSFQVPIFYSGPYSYSTAAAEKIFAAIKAKDLNPLNRSFKSRKTSDVYIKWLAEEISHIDFGNIKGLFQKMLKNTESYLLFKDI